MTEHEQGIYRARAVPRGDFRGQWLALAARASQLPIAEVPKPVSAALRPIRLAA